MKVLVVATYELGHQPASVAGLGAALIEGGHEVGALDLAVEPFQVETLAGADAVVFSVPMHTATELAIEAASHLRGRDGTNGRDGTEGTEGTDGTDLGEPGPRLAFAGLYAPVLEGHPLLREGDLLAAGEAAAAVLAWLGDSGGPPASGVPGGGGGVGATMVDLGPPRLAVSPLPARHLLPPLDRYARFLGPNGHPGAGAPAASVEASRGCNHRCRHCPVAAVYGGRSRAVPVESVLADIAQVVELGAGHLSFADPDFLNRPAHSMAVARELHASFPDLGFDATIKVEHLLRNRELVGELGRLGLRFVVSAFESTDDAVLARLGKGHVADDELEAVRLVRAAGVELRPSWLPFTPWTTARSLAGLLDLSARADLVASTDAVQYTIRLLLPAGSLLLEDQDPVLSAAVERAVAHPELLAGTSYGSVPWRHAEPALESLQHHMASLVEEGSEGSSGSDRSADDAGALFGELWQLGLQAGLPLDPVPGAPEPGLASALPPGLRPRLSETWFCCAEPTNRQLALVRSS